MEIHLRRAYSADDLFRWNCGLCEVPFTPGSVYPDIEGGEDSICEECLAYLHARQPELFPSVELLRELMAVYPTAVFGNDRAVMKMEIEDKNEAARLAHECRLWTRSEAGEGMPA
ncbi:MAG: hypothetical protein H0U55_17645 [Rubrobacteraceae bacterium]|nr:hypothetical protein [Rubrobacteraceae bacterium]